MHRVRSWAVIALTVAVVAGLAACAPDRNDDVPMPVPTTSSSASPSAEPDPDPTMLPGGTALANRAYFDFVNQRLIAKNKNPTLARIVTTLVQAGFSKSAIEITPEKTSELRRPVDSMEFSVRIDDQCLSGQFESGGYHSLVGPVLSGGRCLIGKTASLP
jgi:hypothetical protein